MTGTTSGSNGVRFPEQIRSEAPSHSAYAVVSAALLLYGAALWTVVAGSSSGTARSNALLAPLPTNVALVGMVWLVMLIVRNYAVLRGAPARARRHLRGLELLAGALRQLRGGLRTLTVLWARFASQAWDLVVTP